MKILSKCRFFIKKPPEINIIDFVINVKPYESVKQQLFIKGLFKTILRKFIIGKAA